MERPERVTRASEYGEDAICPHCGAVQIDSWELDPVYEHECVNCGGIYHLEREVICRYTTETDESYRRFQDYVREKYAPAGVGEARA